MLSAGCSVLRPPSVKLSDTKRRGCGWAPRYSSGSVRGGDVNQSWNVPIQQPRRCTHTDHRALAGDRGVGGEGGTRHCSRPRPSGLGNPSARRASAAHCVPSQNYCHSRSRQTSAEALRPSPHPRHPLPHRPPLPPRCCHPMPRCPSVWLSSRSPSRACGRQPVVRPAALATWPCVRLQASWGRKKT